jgi:hypothetical protein
MTRNGSTFASESCWLEMLLAEAAEIVESGIDETLSYHSMPPEQWHCLRTNNPLDQLMREVRRRTRVVGEFPDGQPALMLVASPPPGLGRDQVGYQTLVRQTLDTPHSNVRSAPIRCSAT